MFGTASTAKQDYVASLGVEPIDYRTEDFVARVMAGTDQQGVDAVFDAVSVDNFERSFTTLKPSGTLVTYGFYTASANADAGAMLDNGLEFLRWSWLQFRWNTFSEDDRYAGMYSITGLREEHPDWFQEDLSILFRMLAAGEIKPNLWKILPLEDAALAHRYIEEGDVQGKIVLRLAEDMSGVPNAGTQ